MKTLEEAGFAVHMVGGGGMGVSHQTDSHTYVLDAGNEHIKLLDKKMSGRWTDVTATRVPFFPTWWLEHDPALYDDARQSAAIPQTGQHCG